MKENNIILTKSYQFAVRIIKTYQLLLNNHKDYTLTRQLLKSGTSIGANIEEAIGGQSKADFIAKISIAYKESRETIYWMRLLSDTTYLEEKFAYSLLDDTKEIQRILSTILISSKRTQPNS